MSSLPGTAWHVSIVAVAREYHEMVLTYVRYAYARQSHVLVPGPEMGIWIGASDGNRVR
jgi:hypothetical protein